MYFSILYYCIEINFCIKKCNIGLYDYLYALLIIFEALNMFDLQSSENSKF